MNTKGAYAESTDGVSMKGIWKDGDGWIASIFFAGRQRQKKFNTEGEAVKFREDADRLKKMRLDPGMLQPLKATKASKPEAPSTVSEVIETYLRDWCPEDTRKGYASLA